MLFSCLVDGSAFAARSLGLLTANDLYSADAAKSTASALYMSTAVRHASGTVSKRDTTVRRRVCMHRSRQLCDDACGSG